ncbi:DUF2157 domain-containing protein [Arvimicrobium flavum]|uniref:DUF2157 domain-containing protein n=1 Tax=Arvimicrobium flavum TaxID=3393320 RepID=UPI00237BE950|nr:DUF2157 domain-containing protein [Mesorhizobium shangrilense]
MFDYQMRVRRDIERWTREGLIDARTADLLDRDVGSRQTAGASFGSVLAIMAAILLGASILIFVAANWEGIPRIARVLGLFALIATSYVGGAVLKQRDHPGFGEALFVLGAVAFGGSIALIGQMYHFAGDETEAILIWCAGTMVAAIGLRSPVLTNASVIIAVVWLLMREFDYPSTGHPHGFLLLGAASWAISYWTRSRAARHLLVLSAILYAFLYGIDGRQMEMGVALVVVSAIVFAAALWAGDAVERLAQLGGPYPAHPLIGFMVGMSMIQVEVYDQFGPMLLTTLVAFAGIVAALVLRGRESALMRWIAYAAFTVELCLAYVITVGTMMDTAGLFLFSGLALAAVAFIISRIERRLGARPVVAGRVA